MEQFKELFKIVDEIHSYIVKINNYRETMMFNINNNRGSFESSMKSYNRGRNEKKNLEEFIELLTVKLEMLLKDFPFKNYNEIDESFDELCGFIVECDDINDFEDLEKLGYLMQIWLGDIYTMKGVKALKAYRNDLIKISEKIKDPILFL